jgi:hypothetical protein
MSIHRGSLAPTVWVRVEARAVSAGSALQAELLARAARLALADLDVPQVLGDPWDLAVPVAVDLSCRSLLSLRM